jgi:hypothetical protein
MNQMVTKSLRQQLDLEANCQGLEGELKKIVEMERNMWELHKPHIRI